MRRWWRIDPWGPRQALSGLMLVVGLVMAVTLVAAVLETLTTRRVGLESALGMVGALALMTVWLTLVARFYLVGIYVNDRGVQMRYTFSNRTLPWSQVAGFEVRAAEFLGEPTVRDACWVRTAGGAVETPVQRRSRATGWRKNVGPVLRTEEFDRVVARLDAELAAARQGQAGGGVVLR
ncbi:PH domain-containing protein [Micromonospora sp. NPDC000018]|uniref:PH domain-containing protein n=1 Tax=Micromonospora sp. NPDC000018 TaxID=3154239 RepID=UPI00331DBF64